MAKRDSSCWPTVGTVPDGANFPTKPGHQLSEESISKNL